MAPLTFQGGLAGAADVFKKLLLSQSQIYENEQMRQLRARQIEIQNKILQSNLEGKSAQTALHVAELKKIENDMIAAGQKAKEAADKEKLQEAGAQTMAQALGRPYIPGHYSEYLKETLVRSRPPKPEVPKKLTLSEKITQARLMRQQELTPLLEERRRLAFELKGPNPVGVPADIEPVLTSEDLNKLYAEKAYSHPVLGESKPQVSFLENFTRYNELNNRIAKIKDDPNSLKHYLDRVREMDGTPLDEEVQQTEEHLAGAAAAQEDPNAARIKVLEEKIDSNNFTDTDLAEYKELVRGK